MFRFASLFLILVALCSAGCLKPLPLRDELVMAEVLRRYGDFYPTDAAHRPEVGLVRPRFGVPVIAQVGTSFTIEVLQQPGAQSPRAALLRPDADIDSGRGCLSGQPSPTCFALDLELSLIHI